MNKTELIKKVAAENGLSLIKATAVVNSVFASIEDSLAAREPVSIFGFGNFSCRHRGPRDRKGDQDQGEQHARVQSRESVQGHSELRPCPYSERARSRPGAFAV